MGRQIYFAQTEKDTELFVEQIYKMGCCVMSDEQLLEIDNAKKFMIDKMGQWRSQVAIVMSSYQGPLNQFECFVSGNAVEFLNSTRSRAHNNAYEVGRIYVRQNRQGHYNEDSLWMYDMLCRYIKKNYLYNKKYGEYYAPDLWEKFEYHGVLIAKDGRLRQIR